MSEALQKSIALVNNSIQAKLLDKVIAQLQKDLERAGVVCSNELLERATLITELRQILTRLVEDHTDVLYTFLYVVDVSEFSIRQITNQQAVLEVDHLLYLILKREYQKVQYRENL
ncbi:hypothetical protein [Aquimarina brevivitae]|uniref:Uncharacterized protein n=1 Tax=Aquimarina brevivitae TaxID=323412 RepID=A0A4Q7PF82_9FLAO|nr:hypothetical protein [Aquimarina brevivitae]RZS98975.1 hypothetical protein EV197_0177 [Aquimarina brevivitae]